MRKIFALSFLLYIVFINVGISQDFQSASSKTNSTKEIEEKIKNESETTDSYEKYILIANASKDYPVTPGDVYQLVFAVGTTPVTYTISVDSTYNIKVANLATINAEGKTFLQLKKQVEDVVNRNYPMGGVQFVIYKTSVFQVTIKGEVKETQIKNVCALNRVSFVLATNLTEFASERNITIISRNGTKKSYDLFKAKRFGDMSQDPYLRPDDVILVNHYDRIVNLEGAVQRPGSYELLPNENLKELIEIYGNGLVDRADTSRIELMRTYDVVGGSGRKIYLGENSIKDNYELLLNDSIYISSFNELKSVVFIEGAVSVGDFDVSLESSNKIELDFEKDENYAFLIRKNKEIFSSTSDLKNAYIRRGSKIIPINLEKILYDASYYSSEVVMEFDSLVVPFKQVFVSVAGAVVNPGRYPYIPDRTWEYYIGLAGGFNKDKNSLKAISIIDTNNKKCSKDEFIQPEYTITAETNSFTYYFSKYTPIVTTVLSSISTIFTIIAVTR